MVGGTSMGSFIGALWCEETSYTPFVQRSREWSNVGHSFFVLFQQRISVLNLTHYHTMLHFDALETYSCGKQLLEKEKLLVTSNFSFSDVFYHMRYLFFILTLSQTSPGFYVSAVQVF